MADLLQNVQEVYKKWESRSPAYRGRGRRRGLPEYSHRGSSRSSTYNRPEERRFRQFDRSRHFKQPRRFEGLTQFKMAPSVATEGRGARAFVGHCCSKCLPISRANADKRVFSLSVCNVLNIPHLQCMNLSSLLSVFKSRTAAYPDVSSHVLKSERVYSAVEKTIEAYQKECDTSKTAVSTLTHEQHNRAKKILENVKSSVSIACCQVFSVVAHYFLSGTFTGILVHKGQIEILKARSEDNIPVIYLPVHCSNLDYILISFILYMSSLKVPLVVVDSDLYIPLVGHLLRFLGAIYISRVLESEEQKADELQLAVTESYLAECLRAGHSFEFSIDGNSRRPPPALSGLLSFAIDAIEEEKIDDVYISPISLSYEKLIDKSFVYKQLSQKRKKEQLFTKLITYWRQMHCNFGSVRVTFGQPFSLKEFLKTCSNSFAVPCTDTPPSSPRPDRDRLSKSYTKPPVHTLLQHVMHDVTNSVPLMSTQLVAFLFTTQYRKGVTQQQLQNSMEWIRTELFNRKRDAGFTGESLPVVRRAVEMLGRHLVETDTVEMEWTSSDMENNNVKVTVYKPVVKLPHILELHHYARPVVSLFLLESMVVNALYALVDVEICHFRHCDSKLLVLRDEVVNKALELSQILQFEFVAFAPCDEASLSFSEVIESLIGKECLKVAGAGMMPNSSMYGKRPHPLSFEASDDDENDYPALKQQHLRIELSEESINHLEFLRSVLSPYIESQWVAAVSLLGLIDEVKEETVFVREMQLTAQDKLSKGLLAYEESFSADAFRNSLRVFQQWCVLERHLQDGIGTVYLSDFYNCPERINDVIERVEQFRK